MKLLGALFSVCDTSSTSCSARSSNARRRQGAASAPTVGGSSGACPEHWRDGSGHRDRWRERHFSIHNM
jgi:hypothetical protein